MAMRTIVIRVAAGAALVLATLANNANAQIASPILNAVEVQKLVASADPVDNARLSALDLPKPEHFTFAGAAGAAVHAMLLRPPAFDAAKKYPVLMVLHGGPETQFGDTWSFRWNTQTFASPGYAVLMINRRGSTGFGQQFTDDIHNDWGGKPWLMMIFGLGDGRQLALCARRGDRHKLGPRDLDLPHFAFAAPDRRALKSWEGKLRKAGVDYETEQHGDQRSLYFRDPNGIVIEITAPPTETLFRDAPEAHAVVEAMRIARRRAKDDVVVVCFSGRGDKDAFEVARLRGEEV